MKKARTVTVRILQGDCRGVLATLPDASVDSIVTDPPAGIGFMGKGWDSDKGGRDQWIAWMQSVADECLRVLKPGGHALVWALPRTSHWTATAWENAGFEVRDRVVHCFGSGFPKSLDVSKAIDKMGGASVTWFGPWLRSWREANGITQKQIALLFPSKTGGLTGCVANWELGLNMPTIEQFNLIRDAFGLPFDSIDSVEREVLGVNANVLRAQASQGGTVTFGGAGCADITAPTTDAARQWAGWGTALKPAMEDWWLLRKPLAKGHTVAANVLAFGTGALNIDGCRVPMSSTDAERIEKMGGFGADGYMRLRTDETFMQGAPNAKAAVAHGLGRWPSNLIHDGSEEVLAAFPQAPGQQRAVGPQHGEKASVNVFGDYGPLDQFEPRSDTGSAARFFKACKPDDASSVFYTAKASAYDRNDGTYDLPPRVVSVWGGDEDDLSPGKKSTKGRGNHHPTVKPTELMRYLCRLITPPGGTILDPFMGSGSTLKAAELEGFSAIGIEIDPAYVEIARRRIGSDFSLFVEIE